MMGSCMQLAKIATTIDKVAAKLKYMNEVTIGYILEDSKYMCTLSGLSFQHFLSDPNFHFSVFLQTIILLVNFIRVSLFKVVKK
ncbi:uncharacterized protein [Rutidosis leptorrhynchoides]|uniref:uncharacterized protein isoform X3 n=1 Tax=Rutidosis leptorrhynchoides TaxID=125765 RepID=UPI003A9A1E73